MAKPKKDKSKKDRSKNAKQKKNASKKEKKVLGAFRTLVIRDAF